MKTFIFICIYLTFVFGYAFFASRGHHEVYSCTNPKFKFMDKVQFNKNFYKGICGYVLDFKCENNKNLEYYIHFKSESTNVPDINESHWVEESSLDKVYTSWSCL